MTAPTADLPLLLTGRLRLRPPTIADFPASFAMWSDPVVTRFIGGQPHTKEQVWGRLLRYIGHWQALGFGYWAVETIEDGRYVGEVGFSDFRRDIEPGFDGIPEIGWVLSPSAHGRGLASEAAQAALAWRDRSLPPGETVAIIAPEHTASLRIAEKFGFQRGKTVPYHGAPIVILRRPAA